MLLVLAHLFRKLGNPVRITDAIQFLSFECRYGPPTDIREMFNLARENEMVTIDGEKLSAGFLYDKQILPMNLSYALQGKMRFRDDSENSH